MNTKLVSNDLNMTQIYHMFHAILERKFKPRLIFQIFPILDHMERDICFQLSKIFRIEFMRPNRIWYEEKPSSTDAPIFITWNFAIFFKKFALKLCGWIAQKMFL